MRTVFISSTATSFLIRDNKGLCDNCGNLLKYEKSKFEKNYKLIE
jgi:hypothetical protein